MSIMHKGYPLSHWAKIHGISSGSVCRKYKEGIRGDALFVKKKSGRFGRKYDYMGESISVPELAKRESISRGKAYRLIRAYIGRCFYNDKDQIATDSEAWEELNEDQIKTMKEFEETHEKSKKNGS